MPMTRSSVLRRASVVLAVVLLAGCTGEAAPAPTAPVTSTSSPATSGPTPSISPSAGLTIDPLTTPPPVPADLKTPGQVGSKAAVEYFVALHGYTTNTGDTDPLRTISTENCKYCSELASDIDAWTGEGWRFEGDGAQIASATFFERESSASKHVWIVDVTLSPSRSTDPNGTVSEPSPGSTSTRGILAVWTGEDWRIGRVYGIHDKGGS